MVKRENGANSSMNTIIGESSSLNGDFVIVGSVKVEGSLEGSLKATERLVVGQGGVVKARITVRDAIIGGEFTGTIQAESRVELESTAKVRASLKTMHLVIQEGALFRGQIESGDEDFGKDGEDYLRPEQPAAAASRSGAPAAPAEPAPGADK